MGQIGTKWDKFGTFSDQISVQFGSPSQIVLISNLIWKSHRFVSFGASLTHFGAEPDIRLQDEVNATKMVEVIALSPTQSVKFHKSQLSYWHIRSGGELDCNYWKLTGKPSRSYGAVAPLDGVPSSEGLPKIASTDPADDMYSKMLQKSAGELQLYFLLTIILFYFFFLSVCHSDSPYFFSWVPL